MNRRLVNWPVCIYIIASLMITYGECRQCSDFKRYGKQCENLCPHTCLNSTCKLINSGVVCIDGCVAGKTGRKCGVDCPGSCTQCERYGDKCIGPCRYSQYYGDICDMLCSFGCRDGCNNAGVCFSCKSGYRGKFCTETCPQFCKDCEVHTIKCMDNCVVIDYYGDHCDKPCHGHCRDGCNRFTGMCNSCTAGYRGEHCNKSCSSTCTQCERHGDRCVGPCVNLENYGDYCDKMCPRNCADGCGRDTGLCGKCKHGFIGSLCNVKCPFYCSLCNMYTGECLLCVDGRKGKLCDEFCPSNCTKCDRFENTCVGPCPTDNVYGQDCSIQCAHVCNGCDKTSIVCKTCATGYSRTYCDEMCSRCTSVISNCNSESCIKREPYTKNDSLLKVIFGVVAVFVVAGVGLVSAVIIYRQRKRNASLDGQRRVDSNQTDHTDQTDQIHYWATKYWEIKDEDMDSLSNKSLRGQRPRCPSPPQQGRECSSVSFREEITLTGQSETTRDRRQMREPCSSGDLLSGVNSVLENNMYRSAGECTAYASGDHDLAGESPSLELSNEDIQIRRNRRLVWRDKDGREVSVTSEDLRLTRKTDSMLLWEQNTDFSQVYVKYVTPNSPACK